MPSCKTQTLNPWIFQASFMLILPITFMPGDFRCCQVLGKFFSDASFRHTAAGQAFVYLGVFFKWIVFPFRYHNQPQMISWWLNRVSNVRCIPFSSCRAWGSQSLPQSLRLQEIKQRRGVFVSFKGERTVLNIFYLCWQRVLDCSAFYLSQLDVQQKSPIQVWEIFLLDRIQKVVNNIQYT